MNPINLLSIPVSLILAGCATKPQPAADTVRVTGNITRAQSAIGSAGASAAAVGGRIGSASSLSRRIDAKATVLLENW